MNKDPRSIYVTGASSDISSGQKRDALSERRATKSFFCARFRLSSCFPQAFVRLVLPVASSATTNCNGSGTKKVKVGCSNMLINIFTLAKLTLKH
jgi:hypothetical protein